MKHDDAPDEHDEPQERGHDKASGAAVGDDEDDERQHRQTQLGEHVPGAADEDRRASLAGAEIPHDIVIVYVTATPAAPPNGTTLETALPAKLSTSAWGWVRPGMEFVSTKL